MSSRKKTLQDLWGELSGASGFGGLASWPPDAFAFTSMALEASGAYRRVVSPSKGEQWPPRRNWAQTVQQKGRKWAEHLSQRSAAPFALVQALLTTIQGGSQVPVGELAKGRHWDVCRAILELHALADEACAGVGHFADPSAGKRFISRARARLIVKGTLSRLPKDRVRVAPKIRTPQSGINIRSLSKHLSAVRGEVDVEWFRRTHSESTDRTLNLLLLPWPLEVLPSDFKKAAAPNHLSLAEGFGFFDFDPSKRPPVDKIGQIVDAAQAQVGDIHGIILPESALSERDFREAKRLLSSHSPQVGFFLSGVRKPDTNCALMTVFEPQDAAATESEDRGQDFEQHKHHRWYLDDDQIRQYHLGGSLHPDTRWWESMKVRSRRLHFLSYYDWLVMVPLVCEDLARPDPVADIVRAVGPNLVIALLLDGPQLAQRWSGRYASILADDPGSSVLSLTSLGMVTRSNPPGTSPSRVVALWRDPRNGHREISLDRGSDGVVVMLSGMQDDEWTADGRKDSGTANCLVLSGVEQVAAP